MLLLCVKYHEPVTIRSNCAKMSWITSSKVVVHGPSDLAESFGTFVTTGEYAPARL